MCLSHMDVSVCLSLSLTLPTNPRGMPSREDGPPPGKALSAAGAPALSRAGGRAEPEARCPTAPFPGLLSPEARPRALPPRGEGREPSPARAAAGGFPSLSPRLPGQDIKSDGFSIETCKIMVDMLDVSFRGPPRTRAGSSPRHPAERPAAAWVQDRCREGTRPFRGGEAPGPRPRGRSACPWGWGWGWTGPRYVRPPSSALPA